MNSLELLKFLSKEIQVQDTDFESVAVKLDITSNQLKKLKNQDSTISASELAKLIVKSQKQAVSESQYHSIKPIVEFYPIDFSDSKRGAKYEIFPLKEDASPMQNGVRDELINANGIYIFYDSRGKALYAGKAKAQNLWTEMNNAYNRTRQVQRIKLVQHPSQGSKFKPAFEQTRQPKDTVVNLVDLSWYFSAYKVEKGMFDDLESLIVRSFANDLSNIRMEKFSHSK